ncbi:hypothetical protein HNO52_00480 [Billgrantia diversa]|uniref:hypothetical protein n=1 Tax=Halomonas sp. MCCC 1A13316 TaxID=2733487 RepID=UPI0018A59C75|nr:hypothetical protein [Halomonas sp. MCCC 1A13316]QOR37145.1 hypothetical protein HNO52_00480 [Halomonas sp. MCCC 1A13316]
MNAQLDKEKVKYGVCIVLWSFLASYFGQPLIHGNQDAINVIVTVFSILAGFLVAVITLIGDPKSLPSGGWQMARLGSDLTYNRLVRHKWLFKGYLITLFLIFSSIVVKGRFPTTQVILEYIYMFIASISCFISFKLPSALMELQKERIEHEIQERRKQEGIDE